MHMESPSVAVFTTQQWMSGSYEQFTFRIGRAWKTQLAEEALRAWRNEQGWSNQGYANEAAERYEELHAQGHRTRYALDSWALEWRFQVYSADVGSYCEGHWWNKLHEAAAIATKIGKRAGGRGYDMHPSNVLFALKALRFEPMIAVAKPQAIGEFVEPNDMHPLVLPRMEVLADNVSVLSASV